MMTDTDAEPYFAACRLAFRNRPEAHRIALYIEHADRDRESSLNFYRLADACLDGGSISLWRLGVGIALTRAHDTARSVDQRREALRRLGDWSAWQEERWPTKLEDLPPTVDRWWDGVEDLTGKTLLITDLGAYGDTIHWLRFADALHDTIPAPVFWPVSTILLEFAQHNFRHLPRMHAIDGGQAWDPTRTDCHYDRALTAHLLPKLVGSLPQFVRRRAPAPLPRPERTNGARLGIVWGTQHVNAHLERSIPIGLLAPFFWRPDIAFYSLQVGVRAQEANLYPRLHLPEQPLQSFADTANLIASLDGVITVDTSVAHLAGALGVPTLTLLPFPGDKFWGVGDSTPWYPTMRLIRQVKPWDWSTVQFEVNDALESHWWEAKPI